jgi:hypothetical protein
MALTARDAGSPAETSPSLYRYREGARELGISISLLKKLVLTGQVRSVLIGTARRIPRTEIQRLAEHGLDAHT